MTFHIGAISKTSHDGVARMRQHFGVAVALAAGLFVPSPSPDLKALVGRSESDELRAIFQIASGQDGLMIRANDSPGEGVEFRPVDRDTFSEA